ncbi:MAG: YitT family protein [Oscillospiraceae bacterium]|nr:YitT family protein [Oscillospiraceae bacterium]
MTSHTNTADSVFKEALHYVILILGSMIAAFALEKILIPVQIMDGGMVGIAMIISTLTKLPLSVLTIALNLPLVWIGGRKLERSFLIRTITAMVTFSLSIDLFGHGFFEKIVLTEDKLLATVFGGLLLGLGVGLVLLSGGCLDGTEAVAILISKKMNFSVGQVVLFFNVLIYLTAGILFGMDRALYSLLTYIIVSRIEDFVNTGMQQGKAVMIITNQGEQIAQDIYDTLGRTVTIIQGSGLISGEKVVLYCVITRIELSTMRKIIEKDDYSAFMSVSDVSEIIGKHIKNNAPLFKQLPPIEEPEETDKS